MTVISRRGLVRGGIALAGALAVAPAGTRRASAADTGGWQADPDVVAQCEADRPGFNFRESEVPAYELPDPLVAADGSRVTTPEGWVRRREEILELFRTHVYGRRPALTSRADGRFRQRFEIVEHDPAAMDGAATLKRIVVHTDHPIHPHRFEVILFLPNAAAGAVPVFLLLNNRGPENTDPTREQKSDFWPAEQVIARGYGIAALQVSELAPDDPETFRDGIIRVFEGRRPEHARRPDAWATLSAWGWGGSRALDYFETDPRVDAAKVAVVGHSRGGKAALWAGAEDERFALVVSNDSGCGGAALSRRRFGETVAEINGVFPHWFCRNFRRYDDAEDTMPVDQHMLLALMAPRAVCVGSADEDLWSDPRGEFLSQAHASPVYGLWGHGAIAPDAMPALDQPLVIEPREYHIRTGGHNLTTQDWGYYNDVGDLLWR